MHGMNKKPCRACGQIAEHYNSISTCCKACWRARVTARRNSKIEEIRAYDRARAKLPHRKELFRLKTKRNRAEKAGMQSAHNAVARKTKKDKTWMPLRCERCRAKTKLSAHHDDYSKPLDVMWLCSVCHAARHRELGRLRTVDSMA